jgi:hypothetical protein
VRTLPKLHRTGEQQPARHAAPAWPGRPADDSISYDDVTALPDPDWIGAPQLGVFDASLLEPLELTAWGAELDALFEGIDLRLDYKAELTKGDMESTWNHHVHDIHALTKPLFADLADFAAELDDDRAALFAGIATERMVIGDWVQYAKSFVGLVPGATPKAGA